MSASVSVRRGSMSSIGESRNRTIVFGCMDGGIVVVMIVIVVVVVVMIDVVVVCVCSCSVHECIGILAVIDNESIMYQLLRQGLLRHGGSAGMQINGCQCQ
jgi:hypothetical protein